MGSPTGTYQGSVSEDLATLRIAEDIDGSFHDDPLGQTTNACPAAAPPQGSVGEPGFWEGLIPFWGSGRQAVQDFQTGHPVWGTVNLVLAASDIFLVKAGLTILGKVAVAGFAKASLLLIPKLVIKEAEKEAEKKGEQTAAKAMAGAGGHVPRFKPSTTLDLTGPSVGFTKNAYPRGTGYVYILRDKVTGEILKVGKTTGGVNIYERFNKYRRKAQEFGYQIEAEFWEAGSSRNALDLEGQIRTQLKSEGFGLPWDKVANPGSSASGLPWEQP